MSDAQRTYDDAGAVYPGAWHGARRYFGLHYDLHARETDTDLGARLDADELAAALERAGVDFVQTDCKGHPGYTGWFSRVETASVSPGIRRDALEVWREATRRLGLPLHCHYSGVWDAAATRKFPKWRIKPSPAETRALAEGHNTGAPTLQRVCLRSPYLDRLLIPQFEELIDRYEVDGFWVDGDIWAVKPCYCPRCKKAWEKETGGAPPTETTDPAWPDWMRFTRRAFHDFVARYCEAVRARRSGALVCSNWLQTFRDPGPPVTPTDWVSGDVAPTLGLDSIRCEARFISTRGKPWDIMVWGFYRMPNLKDGGGEWVYKTVDALCQEAATPVALGGAVQVYVSPKPLRDGRIPDWIIERVRKMGRFVKRRRALCQGGETVPQVAVLNSESHVWRQRAVDLRPTVDVSPVSGAAWALLEGSYGVDILDEWALRPRLAEFPVVVAPEAHDMDAGMVDALKRYVEGGGRLLVTGGRSVDRFGAEFLGARPLGALEEEVTVYVPLEDARGPVRARTLRRLAPEGARVLGRLSETSLLEEEQLEWPAATLHRFGRGRVACIPFDVCRAFHDSRYAMTRRFIGDVVGALAGRLRIRVTAPAGVDIVLRRKGGRTLIHCVNRFSGLGMGPQAGEVDEIPFAGPVKVRMDSPRRPKRARAAFEGGRLTWEYREKKNGGSFAAQLDRVRIHEAIVIED